MKQILKIMVRLEDSWAAHRVPNLLLGPGPPRGGAGGALCPRASGSKGPRN